MTGTSEKRTFRIAHGFADHGVESEVLSAFGHVTRYTIDPRSSEFVDRTVQMDLMENSPSEKFDFGVFHPNCGDVADTTSITGNPAEQEYQIGRAREIASQTCDHYVIENKPRDELRDPTVMTGYQFGLPFEYKRAFESSFEIVTPARDQPLVEKPVSPYFYSDRSKQWWLATKGYNGDYPKEHVAKNALPRVYVQTIVRSWLEAVNERDGEVPQDNNSPAPRRIDGKQATLSGGGNR
jgi:hypothetical protein